MNNYAMLFLDNNPMSMEQLRSELAPFAKKFDLYTAETMTEAEELLTLLQEQQQTIALVLASHHETFDGANFLIQLDKAVHTRSARKLLISCGQDIQAILTAVNDGRLDHCLTKPLQNNILHDTVKKELTTYIIEHDSEHCLNYSSILDQRRILDAHIDRQMHHYREGFISDYHKLSDTELTEKVIGALRQFFEKQDDTGACRIYSAHHLLTREDEPNRFLWFITQGEVALYKKDDSQQQREVVRYSKGNIIGSMSFVTGEPSFSTALTLTQTEVIKLDRDIFTKVMYSDSRLLPLFTNLLLRHFNRRLQGSIATKLELQKTIDSLESTHNQLVEKEKMAMLGQLTAGVAHELNNPVTALLRGANTLSQKINWLINDDNHPHLKPQGISILQRALTANPISTAIARARAKAIEAETHDHLIAKKMVMLNLDNDDRLKKLACDSPEKALETLSILENYSLAGSSLRTIKVCTQRIADLVKGLKGYARPDDESLHYVDIHEGIEDTLIIFDNQLKYHDVQKAYTSLPQIACQPPALQQVWTNFVSNAIDAFPEKGVLSISTELVTKNEQPFAVIRFTDNGSGISDENKALIFERNFTTKKEDNFGLGIGLSICQEIIQQHDGWIDVDSEKDRFTTMSVWLPIK